jgi:hypothetical protein
MYVFLFLIWNVTAQVCESVLCGEKPIHNFQGILFAYV